MNKLLILLVFLVGCNPQRKITKAKVILEESGQLAAICAERFPVKDSISIRYDTTFVGMDYYIDTVIEKKVDTVYLKITKFVPKTVTITKEIFRENTARIKDLSHRLGVCTQKEHEAYGRIVDEVEKNKVLTREVKDWKKKAQRGFVFFWLLVISAIVYKFRKPILKLIQ